MSDLEILVQESSFLVVNKPSGLFTQAAPGIASLETILRTQLFGATISDANPFVGLPHRLDKGTSGAVLVARNQRSLKRFGQQFQSRKVQKYYITLVESNAATLNGRLQDYVGKIPDEPKAKVVTKQENGREAILDVRCIHANGQCSLMLIRLQTGRMHQIRLQLASRGFPVWGDRLYGAQAVFEPETKEEAVIKRPPLDLEHMTASCLPLHACRLEFFHPKSALRVTANANLPRVWDALPGNMSEQAESLLANLRDQSELGEHFR
ncbi:MAG: RluA family pseudouridine synthase [Planctomycetota bacterium]